MRIYTRTGDEGTTGLLGGQRVAKCDLRLECVGAVDELNACLGLAASGASGVLLDQVHTVQGELFVLGAQLAVTGAAPAGLPELTIAAVRRLEEEIDAATAQLPPLRNFILPGGTELAARMHVARTVCRRAERALVALAAQHAMPPAAVPYLNRLSDWLFVQAMLANRLAGVADLPWHSESGE